MRVVTEITIHEVDEKGFKLSKVMGRPYYTEQHDDPQVERLMVTDEMIQGQRYIDGDGNELVIGLSEHVQETLGFPLQDWKALNNTLDAAINENSSLYRRINKHLRKINHLTKLVESSKPMNKYQKFIRRTGLFQH